MRERCFWRDFKTGAGAHAAVHGAIQWIEDILQFEAGTSVVRSHTQGNGHLVFEFTI